MNARHWSDAWGTLAELACRLDRCVHRAPVVTMAATALRAGVPADDRLANDVREWADYVAKGAGAYEDHAALTDAADALDELAAVPLVPGGNVAMDTVAYVPALDDPGIVTGEFKPTWSGVIGGCAVTEYEGNDTARYMAVGLGRSDQPPELVRVWAADPDDTDYEGDQDGND